MRQLVYNATHCKMCGKTIVSYHVHDYKVCGCLNEAMVDGGTEYARYGAADMDMIERIEVFADEPHEKVRLYATRGHRGQDGKQPLRWVSIAEMSDGHLEGVLSYGGPMWHLNIIVNEIKFRKNHPYANIA